MSMLGGFMPHGMCFLWRPDVLMLHILSDALIALAYFSIPALLLLFVRKRPDLPFTPVFWMFSLFIVSCGLTHVFDIVVIWQPVYWLQGAVKALTATASIATAITLVPLMPRALGLRSPAELERLNARLQQSLEATEHALLRYEREHYIATTLQDASLGTVPARVGSLEVSAVYHPGVGDLEIGGDWYDLFALPDGRVIASIGDVTGKGLGASVIMAKVRQAIRVAAQVQVEPGPILDAADRALRLEYPEAIVTAFVAIIDDTEGLAVYANAGHPPPLLRVPDGTIHPLVAPGLPLGLRMREATPSASVSLVPGALLLLYTDGLTEATHDYAEGERRLQRAIEDPRVAAAADPAGAIHDAVLVEGVRDDVAILAIRVGASPGRVHRWTFDVADERAARTVRDAMVHRLRERSGSDDDFFAVEMIYGELIGNAARHSPGDVDVRLDERESGPVLHVLDRGPGFQHVSRLPADTFAESGRGLYIIEQLAPEFTIVRRPGGGSHARVVLPLRSASAYPPGGERAPVR